MSIQIRAKVLLLCFPIHQRCDTDSGQAKLVSKAYLRGLHKANTIKSANGETADFCSAISISGSYINTIPYHRSFNFIKMIVDMQEKHTVFVLIPKNVFFPSYHFCSYIGSCSILYQMKKSKKTDETQNICSFSHD